MDGYTISWVINGFEYVLDYDKFIDGFLIMKTETDTGRTEYIKFDDGTYITDLFTAARKLLQIYEEEQHEQTAL